MASLITLFGACSAPPRVDIPVGALPVRFDSALAVQDHTDPGRGARLTLLLEPVAPWESLTLFAQRADGEEGDPARMLVRVKVTEFPGAGPVSFGRSSSQVLVFGDNPPPALSGHPILRTFPLEIDTQAGVLARKVEVAGTLHPVDLVVERTEMVAVEREGVEVLEPRTTKLRNAGAPVPLPAVQRVWCAVEPPTVPVADLLDIDAPPAEIFLASARTLDDFWKSIGGLESPEMKDAVFDAVEALIDALDRRDNPLTEDQREAAFASLLLLTDVSNGRDVSRWRTWWAAQDTPFR